MLDRLRRPSIARLGASTLVVGLAVAWLAPARAAHAFEAERERTARLIAADDASRVEAALEQASRRAVSPEDFAAEVAVALAALPGDGVSPAADALLKALFGRMLQAMSIGMGTTAVVTSAPTHGIAPVDGAGAVAPGRGPIPPAATVATFAREAAPRQAALEARPKVQNQGP